MKLPTHRHPPNALRIAPQYFTLDAVADATAIAVCLFLLACRR